MVLKKLKNPLYPEIIHHGSQIWKFNFNLLISSWRLFVKKRPGGRQNVGCDGTVVVEKKKSSMNHDLRGASFARFNFRRFVNGLSPFVLRPASKVSLPG